MFDSRRVRPSFHVRFVPATWALVAIAAIPACSGGQAVLSPHPAPSSPASVATATPTPAPTATPTPPSASLPAAIATGCIASSSLAQTVALPSAGGLAGTITMGNVGSAVGCPISLEVATGSDATLTPGLAAKTRRRHATPPTASPLPAPIAQVELASQTTSASWLAITLTVPSSVPAGSYPVTITTTTDLGDGQTYSQTLNYTLTVAPNGTAALTGINVTFGQFSTGLLQIYPKGTVLPTPAPSPTPSVSPTGTPTPAATPTATASATATPEPTGTPVPTSTPTAAAVDCVSLSDPNSNPVCGSYTTNGYYDGGPDTGQSASSTPQPVYKNSLDPELVPGQWFVGKMVVTVPNYDPGHQQTFVNGGNCPSTVTIAQSGPNGDTYTLTFPADGNAREFDTNGTTCGFYVEPPPMTSGEPSLFINVEYGPGNTP